ncbi:hypothetical protein CEXT_716361 [Caerostris extrusa]|uniref:Uncharacterized protein n=1 Tax=Caerostris extrusa TaxID=172846 RepID=A0AAV4W357_CAEEX|nr:hypothetical protein CEXT_716361 [Caerostris extrusa]
MSITNERNFQSKKLSNFDNNFQLINSYRKHILCIKNIQTERDSNLNNFPPSNGNQHAADEWLHVVREANSSGNSSSLTTCPVDDSSQKILPPPTFHTICSRKFYSNRTEFSARRRHVNGLNGFFMYSFS